MEGLAGFNLPQQRFDEDGNQRPFREGVHAATNTTSVGGEANYFDVDEQEKQRGSASSRAKGHYNRHTPDQIQELETFFKENPHPNDRERLAIGKKLNIEPQKVKFWFQNRRTQFKAQTDRYENTMLKKDNETLKLENTAMKEAIQNSICNKCGGDATIMNDSIEMHKLMIENTQLREELSRMTSVVQHLSGRPSSSLARTSAQGMMNPSNVFGDELTDATTGKTRIEGGLHRKGYLELASKATDELMKLGQLNAPLWSINMEGGGEILNFDQYVRTFPPLLGTKLPGFVSEASRASAMISMSSLTLVDTLLDANRWREMFVGMIGSSTTVEVIFNGTGDSRNGVLLLMKAEIQHISPLVPVRVVNFIRYSRQHAEGVWVVVDLSVDTGIEGLVSRRHPSGCILHDMPNNFTRVTWIEHTEYNEHLVHNHYRRLLRSGMGFGAQKWICSLLRHCECLRAISSDGSNPMLLQSTKMSLKSLAQRMTNIFCAGVCVTGGQQWELVYNVPGATRFMTRESMNTLGEPSGIIVSATTSVWIAETHRSLFDLFMNKDLRHMWDVLCHGNATSNVIHFSMGQDETSPNCISILSSNTLVDQSPIMILQETASDMTGSLMVYATVDYPTISVVMKGEDTSSVALLPSGLYIVPAYGSEHGGPSSECGSMVTIGFQILAQDKPTSNLKMETISTVNDLVSTTVHGIKEMVRSSQEGAR